MKSLADIGKKEVSDETMTRLKEIFANAKEKIEDYPVETIPEKGQVILDGSTFTYSDRALRMMGFCAVCGMEVASYPVRSLADIGDLLRSFRPARHDCMDV